MTAATVLRGPKGWRIPNAIELAPEQLASSVCLTDNVPTTNCDRYGAPRCESCCTWLDISAPTTGGTQ